MTVRGIKRIARGIALIIVGKLLLVLTGWGCRLVEQAAEEERYAQAIEH